MSELLEARAGERMLSVKLQRGHSRNLSWDARGTPLARKISVSPKVASALASARLSRSSSAIPEAATDLTLEFRFGRHASGNLSMDLFRVPEDRMQQNLELMNKMLDRTLSTADVAAAMQDVLPQPPADAAAAAAPEADFVPIVVAHTEAPSFGHQDEGAEASFEWRRFLTAEGAPASFWHDVPLTNGDGSVNFVCEIPKDSRAKMEVATGEAGNPIKQDVKKGKLRDYPYNIRWNYGMLPRTWEDPQAAHAELGGITGDNDPVDVVEIGSQQLTCGSVYPVKVLGAFAMIDEGELDWKLIAIRQDDPLAPYLDDIDDVERRMEGVLEQIMVWFRDYKMPDGKPANRFGYDSQPQNREVASQVIAETHEAYQQLVQGKRGNEGKLALV